MKESYKYPDDLKKIWCIRHGWDPGKSFLTMWEWLEAHPDKKAAWLEYWEAEGKSLIVESKTKIL